MMDKLSSPGTASPENLITRTTAATPQTTHTPPLEPGGVPMQFQMPFFANPFMSPFMPQQGVSADGSMVSPGSGNPAMPAFFFSPAQYQEMMQQYFTQMMTANQYGMNMAFPMPFGTTLVRPCSQASQSDSVGETVNGLHELHLSNATEREVMIPSTVACPSDSPSSSGKNSVAIGAERGNVFDEQTPRIHMGAMSHGMTSPLHNHPVVGAMTKPFPMTQPFPCAQPMMGPFATQMPFAAAQFHGRGHSQTQEQLAAAFLPQDHRLNQGESPSSHAESVTDMATGATMPDHAVNGSSGGTIAPPPPPARPVHRRISQSAQPSSSEWPEENKENGNAEEPVWVLRDSYLKKMQRELKEEENSHEWNTDSNTVGNASSMTGETLADGEEMETDRLLHGGSSTGSQPPPPPSTGHGKKKNSKETMVHEPAVLIEGVLFRARYLGSTQMMCESRGSKAARMAQAQEAVARVKAPEGEIQPSTEIDLFISTEKIMVLNTDLQRISDTDVRQDILMDHALRTISYIADIGDLVVLMARRMSASSSDEQCNQVDGVKKTPKVICHVFESDEASFIAQSIGQAFQVAYVEFLRANGIDDPSYLRQIDYQEVLNSQELLGDELEMFARKETQKDVVVPKKSGEPLGIVVVESGWGSMLPTVVLAHMNPAGPAARSNQLNIGDQIININGISLVGLPLSAAQTNIKNVKTATAVRLTVVSTPPVVEVRIRRPDTKYQLGGIAERGGIRVGHRIIEINNQSVVAVAHDRIVNMLATAIGEIHMKTMPTSMFRLLTGQDTPQYI
ncbi:Phosphotyrosine interaction domain protein [Trichostrongylus colubriformis]|uniref:Phosphotyrosine interaction domain protein n=1 Tax=Trichostrongylus colubriformis TaxID=6319 RepID=A0AAN8EN63_TRICO